MIGFEHENTAYETYTVADGDTLTDISKRYGVSKNWLKKLNGLTDDTVCINQTLKIRNLILQSVPSVLISSGDISRKQIAVTYDCGGLGSGVTLEILDVLRENKVKGTFFLTGEWVEKFPELANAITDGDHEIGNHSYSHPDFTKLSIEEIKQEILRGKETINHITGVETCPVIRYPYGTYNSLVLEAAGQTGYSHSIQWSLDTMDWKQPPTEFIVDRVLREAKSGDIILMHVHGQNTAKASEIFIPVLLAQGFRLVTVSELM